MSFASEIKNEILSHEFSKIQFEAFLYGLFKNSLLTIFKKKIIN